MELIAQFLCFQLAALTAFYGLYAMHQRLAARIPGRRA